MNSLEIDESIIAEKTRHKGGRAARVVAAVHDATLELLEERGYDRMEIPEVAERAQVNKTSIYRRWPNKLELLLDLALTKLEVAVPNIDMGSLHADLTALLTNITATLSSPLAKGLIRAFITHDDQDDRLKKARATFWDTRFGISREIVDRAIQRGELPKDTNTRDFLEWAAAPVFYRIMIIAEPLTDNDIQVIVKRTCQIFESGES